MILKNPFRNGVRWTSERAFDGGLEAEIKSSSEGLSLGQKQLIAFIRAVLRKPDLLILDEATANIDTVTEQLLETILRKLPATTTHASSLRIASTPSKMPMRSTL